MTDLWNTCNLETATRHISGELYRLVESQEQIATMKLVDSLEAQSLLEEMLETVKPPLAPGSDRLHYLLYSPFRYPPLQYGSRYGARHEPSLFYGSLTRETVLAESAYYRFVFWHAMRTAPSVPIRSEHTLFSARYATTRGLQLQQGHCTEHRAALTHPTDYTTTQVLGRVMREADIKAFEFPSARCPEGGVNVALFTPAAFAARGPLDMQQWLCETTAGNVTFAHAHNRALHRFPMEMFTVEGILPWPAG